MHPRTYSYVFFCQIAYLLIKFSVKVRFKPLIPPKAITGFNMITLLYYYLLKISKYYKKCNLMCINYHNIMHIVINKYNQYSKKKISNLATFKIALGEIRGLNPTSTKFSYQIKCDTLANNFRLNNFNVMTVLWNNFCKFQNIHSTRFGVSKTSRFEQKSYYEALV